MTNRHHRIDYIEFTVRDVAEGKAFFAAAFGWTFNDYGPSYAGIRGAEREMGGLTVGDRPAGGPLVVLYSEDLGQTLQAVEQAGGVVTKPIFEFPGGRRFEFTDPSGNELAVWAESS